MKHTFLLFSLFSFFAFSQNNEGLIILNEGYYDYSNEEVIEPVSIGVFDMDSQIYEEVIIIDEVRFASDMIVDGDFLYIAADSRVLKYDLYSFELLSQVEVQGVRNLLIHNENLYLSRGDYDYTTFSPIVFDSYLQIYDKNSLALLNELDTINGPKWSTQNLVIKDDLVYVAINNGFEWGNEKGLIGVLDANTFDYLYEINLGENGKNPDNMMVKGDYIITVNNKDWSGSSISRISLINDEVVTEDLSELSTGCGTSTLRGDYLNYQISGGDSLYKFDFENMETLGVEEGIDLNFYEIIEGVDNYLYASNTDFFSYGDVYVYDDQNNLVNNFNVGVTPGKLEFFSLNNNQSSILENSFLNQKLIKKINLLGQESTVDQSFGIQILIFENGLVRKLFQAN